MSIPAGADQVEIAIAVEIAQLCAEVHLFAGIDDMLDKAPFAVVFEQIGIVNRAFVFVGHQIDVAVAVDVVGVEVVE